MKFKNQFTTFTAGEAEAITGVPTATQRDWRRHGFLERAEGWTLYDAHSLARLLFMRVMQEQGVGPTRSSQIASSAALRIEWYALNREGAIGIIKPDANLDGLEAKSPDELKALIERQRGEPLAALIVRPTGTESWLVKWADGELSFVDDLVTAVRHIPYERRGAIVAVDLQHLGEVLAGRADGPLVLVKITK
ncbi:MerR family transcriptional regulator [Mesorhizobium sp. Cs1299R1N1]|uniref:MerR family transcriptional regulator n=1 Tax=Mesorhizobium sp. Cs1299R1N1 TaxID=3015172 RepID=UPI00301CF000